MGPVAVEQDSELMPLTVKVSEAEPIPLSGRQQRLDDGSSVRAWGDSQQSGDDKVAESAVVVVLPPVSEICAFVDVLSVNFKNGAADPVSGKRIDVLVDPALFAAAVRSGYAV